MFDRIDIRLAGPICACKQEKLAWSVDAKDELRPALVIWCKTCETHLRISNKAFQARFVLGKPYPGSVETKEDAPILRLVPKDKT